MSNKLDSVSKYLSYILRHKPETIGLTLDSEGWADVSELIECANRKGESLTHELIEEAVETNSKKRFALNAERTQIRANQGHSVAIDLGLEPVEPPVVLYHGTATRFIDSIREQGLIRGSRSHVHLSADQTTAVDVGRRHGKPTVLTVNSSEMHKQGYEFFLSDNGVWLTTAVPSEFIKFETKNEE